MNNIPQKNVILGFRESNQIPYQVADVKFHNNQSINSINMNNSIQQLRDNDLYIENQLNYLSGYQVGPKTDMSQISNSFIDGQKYWGGFDGSGDLSILHKINVPPENTIKKRNSTKPSRYIFKISGIFIAASDNMLLSSNDGNTWATFKSDHTSYVKNQTDNGVIIGVGNNICLVYNRDDELELLRLNKNEFGGKPTAIGVDEHGYIYVGTDNSKIYRGAFSQITELYDGKITNIQFSECVCNFTDGGQVNDFGFRNYDDIFSDTNHIIATLSNGIVQSNFEESLLNEHTAFDGTCINDIAYLGNNLYVALSSGLYKNSYSTSNKKSTNNFVSLKTIGGELYGVYKDSTNAKIVKINDSTLTDIATIEGVTPTDLEAIDTSGNRYFFVGTTSSGIYYVLNQNGTYVAKKVDSTKQWNTLELGVSYLGSDIVVYASQLSSNGSSTQPCLNIYDFYEAPDGSFTYVVDTTTIDNFVVSVSGDNSNGNALYKYESDFIFVDDNSLKDNNGNIKLTFPYTIKKIVRTINSTIGKGYVVYTNNSSTFRIFYVSDKLDNILEIKFFNSPQTLSFGEIKDIVFGCEYVYVVDQSNVYICTYELEDTICELTIRNTFLASGLNSGICTNSGDLYILSGTNLVKMSDSKDVKLDDFSIQYEGKSDEENTIDTIDNIDVSLFADRVYLIYSGNTIYTLISSDTESGSESLLLGKHNDQISYFPHAINLEGIFYYHDSDDCNHLKFIATLSTEIITTSVDEVKIQGSLQVAPIENKHYEVDSTIKYATMIGGNIVYSTANDINVFQPKIENYLTVFNDVPDLKSWGFNSNADDDCSNGTYIYATSSEILLVMYDNFGEIISKKQLLSCDFTDVNVFYDQRLYISYKTPTIERTIVAAYHQQHDYEFEEPYWMDIDDEYYSQIYNCGTDHALFVKDGIVYIDSYYNYYRFRDTDNETFNFCQNVELKPILNGANSVKNFDTFQTTYNIYVLMNLGDVVKIVTINLEPDEETSRDVFYFTPSKIQSIGNIIRQISLTGLDVSPDTRVLFNTINESVIELYIKYGSNVYRSRIFKGTDTTNINSWELILSGVSQVFRDSINNIVFAVTTTNNIIEVNNGYIVATEFIPGSTIKGLGRQSETEPGFVYRDGTSPEMTKIVYSHVDGNRVLEHKVYNTLLNVSKIQNYNNNIYILNDGNFGFYPKVINVSVLKSNPTYKLGDGIADFDIYNDVIYCIEKNSSVISANTLIYSDGVYQLKNISKIETGRKAQSDTRIKALPSHISQSNGGVDNVAIKFSSSEKFKIITNIIPTLEVDSTNTNVSKYVQDDSGQIYILNNYYIKKLGESSILSVGKDIYRADDGFIYKNSSNRWNYYKASTSTNTPLGSVTDIYGVLTNNDSLYAALPDGIGSVVFVKNYYMGVSNYFTQKMDVKQISPITNSLNAYLIVNESGGVYDISQWFKIFNFSGKIAYRDNTTGIDIESVETQKKQYDFKRAIILNGSNNYVKFVYDSVVMMLIKKGYGEWQNWATPDLTEKDIKFGFYFNDTVYLVLNKNGNKNNNVLWSFTGYDGHIRAFNWKQQIPNGNMRKITNIDTNTYIIDSDDGLYYLKQNSLLRLSSPDIQIRSVKYADLDDGGYYYYAIGNIIYRVQTFKKICQDYRFQYINIGSDVVINDLYPKNKYEFIFSTSDGIYSTTYSYVLSNDLSYFSESDVNKIYQTILTSQIDNILNVTIDDHEQLLHNTDSVISRINTDIEDVNFSFIPSNWKQQEVSPDHMQIQNDMVAQILFGTNEDECGISVRTSNFLTSDTPDFDYIIKRYTSGVTEMYLLLDTTNTYYINHIPGAGFSQKNSDSYMRKNLLKFGMQKSEVDTSSEDKINNLATTISILIDDNEFKIDKLMSYHINGCSLPLKIYQDTDDDSYISQQQITGMYQSIIAQSRAKYAANGSIFKTYSDKTGTDSITVQCFTAQCFGTDQQSIAINFYDSTNVFDSDMFSIVFNANDGYYGDDPNNTQYTQKFRLGDHKPLKRNLFKSYYASNVEKVFVGWSFKQVDDNNTEYVIFQNKEEVDADIISAKYLAQMKTPLPEIKRGSVINLFAVWITYQFNKSDTILGLNVGTEQFSINSYSLNPQTNLQNVVLVNFGDT